MLRPAKAMGEAELLPPLLAALLALAKPLAVRGSGGPPFAKGDGLLMDTECEWQTDASAQHVIGLGLAGGPGSPAQASAAACESWCCSTTHMKMVPSTSGAPWQFTEDATGDKPRQCNIWQWKEAPANDAWQKGCWVGGPEFVIGSINPACPACGKGASTDTTWVGAETCLDPGGSAWGTTVLLALGLGGALYVGGGAAWGSTQGRAGRGGRLGPLSAHPHSSRWLEVAGLAADGVAFARGGRGRRGGVGGGSLERKQQLLGRAAKRGKGGQGGEKKRKKKGSRGAGDGGGRERVSDMPDGDGDGSAQGRAPGKWVHVPT
eukprot:COSAG04_NODE_4989_length_1790_cov_2.777646_2_plen_320_part_00